MFLYIWYNLKSGIGIMVKRFGLDARDVGLNPDKRDKKHSPS